MGNDFRLLSISLAGRDSREIRGELFDDEPSRGNGVTVVTGRNGVGKSRLLACVAIAFDALDSGKPRPSERWTVKYSLGGQHCEIAGERGGLRTTVDGTTVARSEMPRPRTVAAVTASAFDKFPLPRERRLLRAETDDPTVYQYLGLKDDRGRISATAGVYRALDRIFDAVSKDVQGRQRIAEVFDYLGYDPTVEVAYRWTTRGQELLDSGGLYGQKGYADFLSNEASSEGVWSIKSKRNLQDQSSYEALIEAVASLEVRGDGAQLSLVADFHQPQWADSAHFRSAQLLKREGFLATKHVRLQRASTGLSVLLGDASSGELALVTAMLGIASVVEDRSLILIDEPEISLHPKWQSEYLERLASAFGGFEGCHFVIATHSPLVASGLSPRTQNQIVTLDGQQMKQDHGSISGRSADETLVRSFGVAGPDNSFIKESVVRALRMTAVRQFNSPSFFSLMSTLSDAVYAAGVDPAVRSLVKDLERTVAKAREAMQ